MKKLLTFLTLLTLFFGIGWAETVTNEITVDLAGISSTNSYKDWTYDFSNGVSYSANTAKNASGDIQMRSSGNSGIVSTTSIGTIKKVVVKWGSGTNSGRTLDIYGKNTAYSSPSDLYGSTSTQGTKLGSIVYGTSTELTVSGSYAYIGLRSNNGAMYITKIIITWEVGGTIVETVATPTFTPDGGTFYEPQIVTLSSTTEGATIYYTKDGSTPDPATSQSVANNGTVTIDETCTLTALATATGYDPSNSYSKLFTINTPKTVVVPPTYTESLISDFGKFYFVDKTNPTSSNIWKSNNYGAVASGQISGTKYETESWLYSPYIDLTSAANPKLSFSHAGNYFTSASTMQSDVKVKVRVLNQTGWSDWSDLTINTWPTGANWTFVDNTTSLADYAGKTIQIAFQYTSSANRAGTWEIKNFKVENAGTFEIFRHYKTLGADNNNADGWMGYWGGGATLPNGDEYADYTVQAESGTTVSFLIGHNNGNYQLLPSNITIVDANGNPVENLVISAVNEHGQTPVSFTMPASNVDITANFTYYRPTVRLAGHFNGRTGDNWVNDAAGPQFTYNATNDEYSIDAYFVGADDNGARDYFFLFLDNNANHPSSGNYPITSVNGEEMTFGLGGGDSNNFSIAPGVYNIKINGAFNKMYVTKIQVPTISFTPAAGEVVAGTPVSATSSLTDIIEDIQDNDIWALGDVSVQVSTDNSNFADNVVINEAATVYAKASIGNIVYTATANYTVKISEGDVYELVQSSTDLIAGEVYLIVDGTDYSAILGPKAGNSTSTYATAIYDDFDYNATAKTITVEEGCQATPLLLGGNETDGWTFQVSDNVYLAYNSTSESGNNYLHFVDNTKNGRFWAIDTDVLPSSKFLINNIYNDKRYIMFNNTNTRFASYLSNSTMTAVALFKKVSSTPSNKSEAPVITPEATTVVGGKVNVTITAADGAAIYYTTTVGQTGTTPDVEDDDQLYNGAFDLNHTGGYKTVTAIAVENGKEPSDPVSKTYLFTSPEAPTFTPDQSVIQSDDFTVTINTNPDYVGAAIYYILDEPVPNGANDVKDYGKVYDAATGVPVTGHGQHTIYAIVELNGMKSSVATATYTIFSEGDEGDWKLVTKVDDIQNGREYVIINSDRDRTVGQFNPVLNSGNFSSLECTNNVLFGPGYNTATVAGPDVTIFMFEKDGNNLYMKSGDTYYVPSTEDSYINMSQSPVYVSITGGFVYIKGNAETTKSFAYNYQSSMHYFASYSNPTTNGNQRPVYMYYREAEPVEEPTEATLAEIENAQGVVGTKYAIADDYLVAVEYRDVTVDGVNYGYVWCKDNKNIANPITVEDGVIDFMSVGTTNNPAPQQGEWDQSNWVVLRFKGDDAISTGLKGHKVTDIVGTYIDDENYMIDVESYVKGDEASYTPNVYCVANFNPSYIANGGLATQANDDNTYFFMPPKVQEVCEIRYAEWDDTNKTFTVPEASGFEGTLSLDWTYNQNAQGTPLTQQQAESAIESSNVPGENGKLPTYKFLAVVQNNPSKGAVSGTNKVYPMNLEGNSSNIITAISVVNANGNVKSVKYVNVAGMVSDVPFQGVNIVVTEYTDGSRTTSKMLRK